MALRLKPGVRVFGIRPEVAVAIFAASSIWHDHGAQDCVVTSVIDGVHSEGSLHYAGSAFDIRIWELDDPSEAADDLRDALGSDFDVVLEETHVHVEFQPKEAYRA